MKIRTDFVTNSSSSSYICINVKSETLNKYMKEHGLLKLFEDIENRYFEYYFAPEINKSMAQSLINVISYAEYVFEDEENNYYEERDAFEEFLKTNKDKIDAESVGIISYKTECGEGGCAEYRCLKYTKNRGTLVRWPGEAYDSDWNFNTFGTDRPEADYFPCWEAIWNDEILKEMVAKFGDTYKFRRKPLEVDKNK